MTPRNPHFAATVATLFSHAPLIRLLGAQYIDCGPGWCEIKAPLSPVLLQHTGVAHAGALATLADHCAGAAATTLIADDELVLTAEFKINLLRPGSGQSLRCRGEVLKAGRMLSVVETSVYANDAGIESLVAKLNATLVILKQPTRPNGA
jgi:uncharacterized protein (TIGR00369 family)